MTFYLLESGEPIAKAYRETMKGMDVRLSFRQATTSDAYSVIALELAEEALSKRG